MFIFSHISYIRSFELGPKGPMEHLVYEKKRQGMIPDFSNFKKQEYFRRGK